MSEGMTALVIKFPTMQFTGIKDKNGKEIYESDIVEFGYVDTDLATFRQKGEVFWNQGWMAWGLQSPMLRIPFWDKTGHAGLTDFIVVGNVYENPELLEKENIDVKEPAAA
jgi:hypothetical protein